jgi:hypothetical protein
MNNMIERLKANVREEAEGMLERARREAARPWWDGMAEARDGILLLRQLLGNPVDVWKLNTLLLSMTPENARFFQDAFERMWKEGLTRIGDKELPESVAEALDKGEIGIGDLANPILELGDLRQYDLKRWSRQDRGGS